MTTENQQMLTALGQLHDDIAGKLPKIDAAVTDALRAIPELNRVYHVAPDGDDTAAGNSAAPLATIREAVKRCPAGGYLTIHLAGDAVYDIIDREEFLRVEASHVRVTSALDNRATLRVRGVSYNNAPDKSVTYGFYPGWKNVLFMFENLIIDTGTQAAGTVAAADGFGGIVSRGGGWEEHSRIDIALHNVKIILRDHPLWSAYMNSRISFRGTEVQMAGSATTLNTGTSATLELDVLSLTLPEGKTLTDLLTGLRRRADGTAMNVLSNIEI